MTGLRKLFLLLFVSSAFCDGKNSNIDPLAKEIPTLNNQLKETINNLKDRIIEADKPKSNLDPEPKFVTPRDLPEAVTEAASRNFRPARPLPLWIPVCFFIHPAVSPQGVNQGIKRLVDEMGQCGIAVDPYVIPVQANLPGSAAAVNELMSRTCNVNETFGVRGAGQMISPTAALAADQCNDPNAGGCSTLCDPFAISHTGPPSPALMMHEFMHGNCCGAACVNEGEGRTPGGPGISVAKAEPGDFPLLKLFHAEEGANLQDTGITPAGCATLREGASPNGLGVMWAPDRNNYYKRPSDPTKAWNLNLRRPYFKPRRTYARVDRTDHPQRPPSNTGGLIFADSAKNPGTNLVGVSAGKETQAAVGDPHKKPIQNAPQENLVGKATIEDSLTRDLASLPKPEESKEAKGLFFDENAKKVGGPGTETAELSQQTKPTISSTKGGPATTMSADIDATDEPQSIGKGLTFNDSAKPKEKSKIYGKNYRRKRGAALKRGKDGGPRRSGLQQRADYLISPRPAPDFSLEPEIGESSDGGSDND